MTELLDQALAVARHLPPATQDSIAHVAPRWPGGAQRVRARIRTVIDLLARYPYVGTRTDDPVIRRMTTPFPYLVFYEVTDVEVIIHAIRHAARNPEEIPGDVRSGGGGTVPCGVGDHPLIRYRHDREAARRNRLPSLIAQGQGRKLPPAIQGGVR